MTAYRRHLPISLACLISLSAGSASFAAGGSALDPYSSVPAPKSLPTNGKNAHGAKKGGLGIGIGLGGARKHVHEVEQKTVLQPEEAEQAQSQTHVSTYGRKSKLVEAPVVSNKPVKVKKPAPVQTTTIVSDPAPLAPTSKATASKASSDESVIGGIKAIGEGYKKTFKAATHGMVSSTKAASSAVLSGSKKMGDGIKSSTKASGGVFKKGAGMIGLGGGDKKDSPDPADTKVAKAAPVATPVKAAVKAAPEKPVAIAEKVEKPKAKDGEKPGMLAKLTHLPKPKMPKIGIPFVGGKKKDKAPAVDKTAGASETGAAYDLDSSLASVGKPTQSSVSKKPLQTPIGEELPASALKPEEGPQSKLKSKDGMPKMPQGGLANANNGGGGGGLMGKIWPFGKKKQPSDINGSMQGVAGKPNFQAPM